ncbi:MAG: GntR family transcriptional regulator [Planctomycetota bacterium]|nr:GntR family transcriptional regulator [Planctomycetota bacterium]
MPDPLVRDPIYQQLHDALRGFVRDGEYKPGQRFLTEREVGARFGVSRATANKALASLVSEGVLAFRKGIGTFVHAEPLRYDLRGLVSFTDKCRAAGREPATRVLRFKRLPARRAAPEARAALDAREAEPLCFVERLRLADGEPVILERRYVVARHCPGLKREDLAGSLYALWTERYRLPVAGAYERIRAVNLPPREAHRLRVRPGRAGLLVVCRGDLEGGEPLWWEATLYRADAYEFHNRLGGLRGVGPAVGQFSGAPADPVAKGEA